VGYSDTPDAETHAFLWDPIAGMRDLGALDGSYSRAQGINDLGQAVGYALDAEWVQRAVVWNPDSSALSLPSPSGWVEACAINDSGLVAGMAGLFPVVWPPGEPMHELGCIEESGYVRAVNGAGTVAGMSDLPGYPSYYEAALWPDGGECRMLGALGEAGSEALALNDAGEVVGASGTIPYAPTSAVHWSGEGTLTDLNLFAPPDWVLQKATAINNRGDIAGIGRGPGGKAEAFVLWRVEAGSAEPPEAVPLAGRAGPLRVVPNPATGAVAFGFETPAPGPVRVQIFDAAGRLAGAFTAELPPGARSITWDVARAGAGAAGDGRPGTEPGRTGLRRGIYLVRADGPGGWSVRGRLVVASR